LRVLSKWPIRVKLLVGLGLLLVMVAILSSSGLYTTYAYRALVKTLSWRVSELPLAAQLSGQVSEMRVTLGELRGIRSTGFPDTPGDLISTRGRMVREEFHRLLADAENTLCDYRSNLEQKLDVRQRMADNQPEHEVVREIELALEQIRETNSEQEWMLNDAKIGELASQLEHLQMLTDRLPSHLRAMLRGLAVDVRGQYRTLIVGMWVTSVSAALVFTLFIRLFYQWIFLPLRVLIHGSRRVAGGNFDYRIELQTHDEMSELAEAMNHMTARFRAIRDDLDRQVQERTKQVVRNEQLASVGFLAAGVAHEINNPLASIAMCSESLEGRIRDLFEMTSGHHGVKDANRENTEAYGIIRDYLRMIQNEAFRCKEITEKLLDFSRIGPSKRQDTELRTLVESVIEMIGHLGRYHGRRIELTPGVPIVASVNAHEIRQVVLNLLTNPLDSMDGDGSVRIDLQTYDGMAELSVTDDGCGMEPAVLERVFEPFFTRRRAGQGTGLGLSITYRIVADHGGTIEARSPGPGLGATFCVKLPLVAIEPGSNEKRLAAA